MTASFTWVTFAYENSPEELASVQVSLKHLRLHLARGQEGKHYAEEVMRSCADDVFMGEAQPGELDLLHWDVEAGVVVYFDREVGSIVTALVDDENANPDFDP
jgi:hypothetical protein